MREEPRGNPLFLQIKPLLSKTADMLMLPELSSTTVTALFLEQEAKGNTGSFSLYPEQV